MLWRSRQPALAYQEYVRRRREKIAAQAALTEFRLFWDSLSRALAGRDKIIIDAEKVPGRRHLLLLEPDQLRPPVPMLVPPARGSRNPRNDGQGEVP